MQKNIYSKISTGEDFTKSLSSSTILIPQKFASLLYLKQKEHGGKIGLYLNFLISRYGYSLLNGLLQKNDKLNTLYQSKDLNLVKVGFTPIMEDWATLKFIKVKLGISICAIFTFLVYIDSIGFNEILQLFGNGVPKLRNFELSIELLLPVKRTNFIKKYRQKEIDS